VHDWRHDFVIVVFAAIPDPDSESNPARTPDEQEAIVSVVPEMLPVQVAPCVTFSVWKVVPVFVFVTDLYVAILSHIKSTPSSFNSVRVMSTPAEVPGLAAPVAGLTVKPIGFGLALLLRVPVVSWPAVLGLPTPVVEVVLNGAQDPPVAPHTSIGWTVMKQGTSPGVGYGGKAVFGGTG
jgi:hypothetical protein